MPGLSAVDAYVTRLTGLIEELRSWSRKHEASYVRLSTDEALEGAVRRFVKERFLSRAGRLFEDEEFPVDLIPEFAAMGLLGANLHGYGCAGMGPVAYGLALQELEYGDRFDCFRKRHLS